MPLSAKEFTDITALIKLIINGYPGNAAIFREYLQNSDDAKATLQRFVFDERAFPNARLVDPVLKDSQGAALVAINDGLLAEADWMALRKINSSSKQKDESQTGKNGLGFRASYHLTENPHIFSGRTLMILDPHHEFESPHDGGISIDIVDEEADYPDQLLPFNSYRSAGEAANSFYNGSIFRLPLRTADQANRSKIKSIPTSIDDMRQVLHDFVEKEFEEVILFLKHITTIEVLHIDPSGQETCLARVTIDTPIPSPVPSSLIRRTTVVSADGSTSTRAWKFHFVHHSKEDAKRLMDSRLEYDIGDKLTTEKLSAIIEAAFPLGGSPVRGRLFTLLPFPHTTNFPIHLNAVFALDPTRQSLKNIQEVGVSTSRERMLVEWNKLIFDTWTPQIWANLLGDLHGDTIRSLGWSVWPPEEHGEDCYWKGLCASLTRSVVDSRLAVFPTVSFNNHPSSLVRIDDPNVLLAPSNPAILLEILRDLGILVIQPPTHIFQAILELSTTATSTQISQLSPQSLHRILSQKGPGSFNGCDDSLLREVLDYLVFSKAPHAGELKYIHGLPWFRCTVNNHRVALGLKNSGTNYIIPRTKTETSVFSFHPRMLAWNSLSENLRNELSTTSAAAILGVEVLQASDVFSFLRSRLSHVSSSEDEIMAVEGIEGDHQWVVEFWSWVIDWTKSQEFFRANLREVATLFLLPTSRGSLRRLSSRVVHFNQGEPYVEAWKTLGVYPISPDLPHSVVAKLRDMTFIPTPRTWPHIAFLIKNCNLNPSNVSEERVNRTFEDIRMSLFDSLPRSTESSLSSTEKTKLRRFPIFMVKTVEGSRAMQSELNTIDGHCRYVDVADNFPLPRLQAHPSAIFVDMRDPTTQSLLRIVEGSVTIEKELQLLQLAVDNWEWQPDAHRDIFIDRVFLNSRRLPNKLRQSLADIPFVMVNDHDQRVTPRNLVHPRSTISVLYQGEPAKMPTGRFSQDDYVSVMQSFGFVRSSLDTDVVGDRLQYITSTTHLEDPRLHDKAAGLLHLLDRNWSHEYAEYVVNHRNSSWLSVRESEVLLAPAQCRDNHRDTHSHPYYYDHVLRVWPTILQTPALRTALGWSSPVSVDVLSTQLISTLGLDRSSRRSDRLVTLIIYLNQLHSEGSLAGATLQTFQHSLNGRAWVPSNSLSGDLIEPQYALLDDAALRLPFCPIDSRLTRVPFLQLMGCSNRPSFPLLLDQLHRILGLLPRQGPTPPFTSSLGREAAIAILGEIVNHHQNHIAGSGIYIPCENDRAYPLQDVYFRDMRHAPLSPAMQGKFAAHSVISSSLAELLGIQLMSSLALGDEDDEDDEEEQMSEDLVTRIRGFLRDYDPQFALNEFLANADDARAQHFSLLLDSGRRFNQGRVVSPAFQTLLDSPFLILHNNSKLSGKDFVGIRRIGQGGKREQIETHGRHGLGALSFYYFTDVVTIISDGKIMILDPSGSYLPPRGRRGKRTILTRNLSDFVSRFPDQLESCEGIFGFSAKNIAYDGTLFFLPLRAKISEKACDLAKTRRYIESSYRQLAYQAFLFTELERITAYERADGPSTVTWSFSATRGLDRPIGDIDIRNVQIRNEDSSPQTTENWIIVTSETGQVPEKHLSTSYAMKLAPSNVKVQLAINVAKVERKEFVGYPFSTVSLPKSTSLPFHINARFAISSNRQSLVINSADSQNQKDAHTSFNTWILESLVPPLYLEALQYLLHRSLQSPPELKSKLWWRFDASDDVSRIVNDALSNTFPLVNAKIFKACNGQWISFMQSVFSRGQPSEITDLLSQLRVPYFVKSPRHGDICRLDSAKRVDPKFVQQAIMMNSARILSAEGVAFTPSHFFTTLEYIRNEPALVGLPLLVLTSMQVTTIPGISDDPIYYSKNDQHSLLFLSSRFVANDYSEETIQHLVNDASVNVITLTANNVVNVIARELQALTTIQRSQWIRTFWRTHYDTFPGPPSLEALESNGMQLVETTKSAISLAQCLPHLVVYDSYGTAPLYSWLPTFLETLQIDFLKPVENSALRKHFAQRFPDITDNILQCIDSKGIHTLDRLSIDLIDKFSDWIQRQLPVRIDIWKRMHSTLPIDKAKLARLPIWSAHQKCSTIRRRPAAEIAILPSHFDIAHILPYLKPNTVLATWSTPLSSFMQFCLGDKGSALSPLGIMSIVTLPTVLTGNKQITDMLAFILSMLQFPNVQLSFIGLSVPDQQGQMRSVQELYDDTNPLFAATLKLTSRSSFLHPTFRSLITSLRDQGLIHITTLTTFRHCANAVSAAYQTNGPGCNDWHQVCQMSLSAFLAYQTLMPPLILTNRLLWMSLDDIAFVRRRSERRQGVSYHVQEHYCAELPEILAPSRFVLSKFEPIAWTQRALFFSEPIDQIITINTKLGVPEAQEVVAHLRILATVIAVDHPGNLMLLSDIRATYKWLSENADQARIYLQEIKDDRIFLNVDDPNVDSWTGNWAAAREIVLNLQYDVRSIKYARKFLHAFEPLLLATGCETLARSNQGGNAPRLPPSSSSDGDDWRKGFNKLRMLGQFTDVVLVPTGLTSSTRSVVDTSPVTSSHTSLLINGDAISDTDPHLLLGRDAVEDIVVDSSQLKAHRVVLAVAIPHLLTLQTWKSVDDHAITFFGSAFGAKAVLDFVYTGELELSTETEEMGVLSRLMRDLLEVLPVADEWDMKDLKEKIQWEIIHKHNMIQRLPHEFDTLLNQAKMHNAQTLVDELEKFERLHSNILGALKVELNAERGN